MSDNKVTLDQLDNSAVEAMSSSVGDVNMLNTENKTIVGALAEIVGKKEIANAIGEPLAETDKFTEMSSEINGLLSTFKTNMMNAGVVVESGDKFKALIDKIKGLTEGEKNKGIQFAEGSGEWETTGDGVDNDYRVTITTNLNFTPTYIFCFGNFIFDDNIYDGEEYVNNMLVSNIEVAEGRDSAATVGIIDITPESFTVDGYYKYNSGYNASRVGKATIKRWFAIGVGEEDTTLRDSLADILEDEGVEVLEEDTMADLIIKTDEEFDRKNANKGLDIISATELPETVVNNQIVLITETEPGVIKLIPNDLCIPSVDSEINIGYSTSTNSYNYTLSQGVSSLTVYLNVAKQLVSSTTSYIDGYIGLNNTWTQFSFSKNIVYDNGVDNLGISTASYWNRDENNGGWLTMTKNANNITIKLSGTGAEEYAGNKYLWCTKGIDFTNFNTCKVTYNYVDGTADMTFVIGPGYSSSLGVNQTLETTLNKDVTNGTMTYNISDLTGLYYIGAEGWANYHSGSDATLTITCIELTNN